MSARDTSPPRTPDAPGLEARTRRANTLLALPSGFWLLAFFVVPLLVMALHSVWHVESFQIIRGFTLENYLQALTEPVYRQALTGSFIVGVSTAAVCVAIALPLAWAVRFHTSKYRDLLLLLIVVASVGSYLARIYSWRSILGSSGVINYFLVSLGVTDAPLDFLIFNRFAVVIALVNLFLPFAFLPIYASLLSVEPAVLEASRVLGAGPIKSFWKVGLPLSSTGLVISFIYVLIFATADFAAPAFLGGPEGIVTSQVIAQQFGVAFNWPLGAALAVLYMVILGAIVGLLATLVMRRTRRMRSES